MVKNPPAHAGDAGLILGWEDSLEGMATHSSILAWEIPWAEEPGGLQSMGSQRYIHMCSCMYIYTGMHNILILCLL